MTGISRHICGMTLAAHKIKTLMRQPLGVWLLLPWVWTLLGVSRAAILVFDFKNLTRFLGAPNGINSFVPLLTRRQVRRAQMIQAAIIMASKYTPWISNCFPQAITARIMLGLFRIPYAVMFGMRKAQDGSLKAHAWVAAGRCHVTGGRSFQNHVTVGCFGRQSWNLHKGG